MNTELEAIEEAIYQEYRRFHEYDPSFRPREVGRLKALWEQFDWLTLMAL